MNAEKSMEYVQYLSKYARKREEEERRETWRETVERVTDYLMEVGGSAVESERERIYEAIYNTEVSPSMRLMATAGKAAKANEIGIYNCSYLPLNSSECFSDLTMLLGYGTGVGFSVESAFVELWPAIPHRTGITQNLVIEDTLEAWAHSTKFLIDCAIDGSSVNFDYSKIRPAGTPLKTRGGNASGPEPLREAHERINSLLLGLQGKELRSIDLFDIACHIASAIVSGGVRRSAMIAIFDSNDNDMLYAKQGEWWISDGQRALANISVVINDFMWENEWLEYVKFMDASKAGEPGIWSRYAIRRQLPERRKYVEFMGPNPCVEQILRPFEFCNLTQAIARDSDSLKSLEAKVRTAALIGTIQSAMINLKDVSPKFVENSIEERLLGVSISGIMDCPIISGGDAKVLEKLKKAAIDENKKWAKALGINPSVSVTCVKPDGNTSVLYNTAPGIHGRHSQFYIRRMRIQDGTPVANFAKAAGIPWEYDVTNPRSIVLSFPIASPSGAVIQMERSAVEQLENWLKFKVGFTETNPSVTITYRENELTDIANWLYAHQEYIVGLSFLPASDTVYAQMPYEEITEDEYVKMIADFPDVDENLFWMFEDGSGIDAAKLMSCVGGSCLV